MESVIVWETVLKLWMLKTSVDKWSRSTGSFDHDRSGHDQFKGDRSFAKPIQIDQSFSLDPVMTSKYFCLIKSRGLKNYISNDRSRFNLTRLYLVWPIKIIIFQPWTAKIMLKITKYFWPVMTGLVTWLLKFDSVF